MSSGDLVSQLWKQGAEWAPRLHWQLKGWPLPPVGSPVARRIRARTTRRPPNTGTRSYGTRAPAQDPSRRKARLAVIALPGVFPALITTLLWATGIYTVYTYVSLFLAAAGDLSPDDIGLVLILLGVCAVGGVWLGGYGNDRFGARRVQAATLPLLAAAFAGLTLAAVGVPHAILAILPLVALWGVSAWASCRRSKLGSSALLVPPIPRSSYLLIPPSPILAVRWGRGWDRS